MEWADGLSSGLRMKKECEERLRSLVPPGEAILAVGTAEELRTLGPEIGSGGGWTMTVLTPVRLLFSRWAPPGKQHEEIRLDEMSDWAHGKQYNCYAVVLTHPTVTRRERVVAHKILWFGWGNAEADVTRTRTIFRFSRPETKVATALRSALQERNVPNTLLRFEERSREDRTRGSHAMLFAKGG